MTRLLDRLIGRSQRFGLSVDDDVAWTQLVSTYGMPDQERILPGFEMFASQAFGGNAIIFSLIVRRLNLFSEAVFKYRNLADKHLFGDPSLGKLEKPWPNGTTGELLARVEQDVSLAGNFYCRDAGDRLERLRPDLVTIISHITYDDQGRAVREIVGYLYEPLAYDSDRKSELYLPEEIVHFSPLPDPFANFRGMSWITPVVREINSDVAMTAHREAYFRNAASPNMVIKYQQRLNQDQRDRVRDAIAARHAGSRNAFGTMVLDAGADLTIVGDRMQGSAFVDLQSAGEARMAMAAGVPAIVAGLQEGRQTGAPGEYSDSVRGFADLTIRPLWRGVCAAFEKFTSPPKGAQLWFDVADISALQPGEKDSAGTMQVQAGTANTLVMGGWGPDDVVAAVTAGDLNLLIGKHSGLTSVQMHKPGDTAQPDNPPPPAAQESGDQGDGETADNPPPPKSGRHRRFDPEEPRDPDGKWSKVGAEVKELLTDERFNSLYPPHRDYHFGDDGRVRVDENGEINISFDGDGGGRILLADGITSSAARRMARNLEWAADADVESGDYDEMEPSPNGLLQWAVDGRDGFLVGFDPAGDVRLGWPNGDGTFGGPHPTGTYDEVDFGVNDARGLARALQRAAGDADEI